MGKKGRYKKAEKEEEIARNRTGILFFASRRKFERNRGDVGKEFVHSGKFVLREMAAWMEVAIEKILPQKPQKQLHRSNLLGKNAFCCIAYCMAREAISSPPSLGKMLTKIEDSKAIHTNCIRH